MINRISISQMIEGTHRLKKQGQSLTHLGIGPMSRNVLKASLELAKEKDFPLILIASRNQVDSDRFGSGYVCGFDQQRFITETKKIADSLNFQGLCYFCRDHGGPWQRDEERKNKLSVEQAMGIAKESYIDDAIAGFDLLHIDPTKDPHYDGVVPLNIVLDRTLELIVDIEKKRQELKLKSLAYEVGTEETAGGLIKPDLFEGFIKQLTHELKSRGLPIPLFVVGQTGTLTRLTENVGNYDTVTAKKLSDITQKYGTGLKEHNGDYLANAILLEHPVIGLEAMNVAPEFGLYETQAYLELATIESKFISGEAQSHLEETLATFAIRSERWRKWMVGEKRKASFEEISQSPEDVDLIKRMCGHYVLEELEVKQAIAICYANIRQLKLDPEFYVIKKIKDSIDRYVYCFNLYGSTSRIIKVLSENNSIMKEKE
ncbi:MAG: class II D-tagatose-bisphosphate aldolase, non-catalytic subunit [Candidatus Izemoplasmatales bacterium]